jgi:hypothetical protein
MRVPSTSARRKPMEGENTPARLFTPVSETFTRFASAMPVNVTTTSLPESDVEAEPIAAPFTSVALAVPADITVPLNLKTIAWLLPAARGSTDTAPFTGFVASTSRSSAPAAPCVLRETTDATVTATGSTTSSIHAAFAPPPKLMSRSKDQMSV